MTKKKKKDLENTDEELEDEDGEVEDEDESEEDEEDSSEDEDDENSEDEDGDEEDEDVDDSGLEDDDVVPAKMYKGLQRTIATRDKLIQVEKDKLAESQKELDDLKKVTEKGDLVKGDMETRIRKQNERLDTLEAENTVNKKSAMKSKLIVNDFPHLAKLQQYIPDADSEDEFRKNCEDFETDLGENVNKALDQELDGSTEAVDDDVKKVSQAQIDKKYEKAMSFAGISGKEAEYDKALADYWEALDALDE